MDSTRDRIDAWERDGLIDPATAARLRAAEATYAAEERHPAQATTAAPAPVAVSAPPIPAEPARTGRGAAMSAFGPGVTVGEMFGYLGAIFLLGAWSAFVARLAGERVDGSGVALGAAIAAAVLIGIALALRPGSPRRRRAAGVALFAATGYLAVAATAQITTSQLSPEVRVVFVAGVALIATVVFRWLLPALVTEFGLVLAITAFASAQLVLTRTWLLPATLFGDPGAEPTTDVAWMAVQAAIWLVVAVILGVFAIVEEQAGAPGAMDPTSAAASAGGRRAALVRVWAGLVAVFGVWSALSASTFHDGEFGRVLPAWLADVAILVIAAVLTERAFRRDSAAFLFAAGIGFLAALTDFNVNYLAGSTEVGLLIEGAILLAVGFGADRLRRRLFGEPPSAPPPAMPPPAPGPPPADSVAPAGTGATPDRGTAAPPPDVPPG